MMQSIIKKAKVLRKKLKRWQYKYYVQNISEVSDEKYDLFLKELRQLELNFPFLSSQSSPTLCIGSMPQVGFSQIRHRIPMLSLNSVLTKSQLLLFDKRIRNKLFDNVQVIMYCCELKVDGIAISLLYKRGKLIQASTRGNGSMGEDVTKNAYMIKSIPKFLMHDDRNANQRLPYFLEIRGEVFISKSCFLKFNQKLLNKGKKIFSNSRNAASGSLRQLDPHVTALRPLSFFCYGISDYIGTELLPDSHQKRLLLCKNWGIPVNNYIQLAKGIEAVSDFYDHIKQIRSDLQLDIDGVVIKVDNCIYQNKLSYSSKYPNWAIAYKFPAESKCAKLNEIIFKVGRTGLITPVAYIDPVTINNVIIKKVNIHNINEIKKLKLMLGDIVRVQRSGDVIPKISEVIFSKRSDHAKIIELPSFCPVCGSVLRAHKYQSSVLRCMDKLTCLAQRKAALEHFFSKKAMNVRGIGKKIINQLIDKNLVSTPLDVFYLTKNDLLTLDRFGSKSADQLLKSINFSKKITLSSFIYALGIPNVGETISKNLSITYKNIENLITADIQSLLSLKFIGEVVAVSIYNFFKNPNNLKNVQNLIHPDVGIQWISID